MIKNTMNNVNAVVNSALYRILTSQYLIGIKYLCEKLYGLKMTKKLPVMEVPLEDGKRALKKIKRDGILDPEREVMPMGDKLVIPVTSGGNGTSDRLPVKTKVPSPFENVAADADIPVRLKSLLPERWERIGDVLLLKLEDDLLPYKRDIAGSYARELGMKTVALQGDISGQTREPYIEVIYGTETETVHLENGVKFMLDTAKIMFSSGNIDERIRMSKLEIKNETVVDMFAGIGYFSLPMAVHSDPGRIYSLEINPVAHGYLNENCRINDVEDVVRPVLGDNRDFVCDEPVDRVVMGYLHDTWRYLFKAMELLDGEGVIHYHTLARERKISEDVNRQLEKGGSRRYEITELRSIKSYAPRIYHVVADVAIEP